MHSEAMTYLARFRSDDPIRVVEFGARNINGSPRWLFPNADYCGVDVVEGVGVDVVADAAVWRPDVKADLVICAEVFEHTPLWRDIVTNTLFCLKPGGRAVFTCAGPTREPHSAVDGGEVRDGEWYGNVTVKALRAAMRRALFSSIDVEEIGADVQATGLAPREDEFAA